MQTICIRLEQVKRANLSSSRRRGLPATRWLRISVSSKKGFPTVSLLYYDHVFRLHLVYIYMQNLVIAPHSFVVRVNPLYIDDKCQ